MNSDRRAEGRVSLATVLVVDDVVTSRRTLRSALEERGCAVIEATDTNHAVEALHHERPDVVVISSTVGDSPDGALDVISRLRGERGSSDVPILIRPPTEDPDGVTQDVMREAAKAAVRADLQWQESAAMEVATFRDDGSADDAVTALVVGIDGLHRMKYDHGELVGLAVMKIAARRLASIVDEPALVIRRAEDAFTILVAGVDRGEAESLRSRIRAVITNAPFSLTTGRALHVTVSVGLAAATRAGIEGAVGSAAEEMERAAVEGRGRSRLE